MGRMPPWMRKRAGMDATPLGFRRVSCFLESTDIRAADSPIIRDQQGSFYTVPKKVDGVGNSGTKTRAEVQLFGSADVGAGWRSGAGGGGLVAGVIGFELAVDLDDVGGSGGVCGGFVLE